MRVWIVLFTKEVIEMWRNFKWIWIPLVFVLIGILQPISSYYMPQILESSGAMPQEAIMQLPKMTSEAVMVKTMDQYGTLGVLILVLAFMGIVSGERVSGVASLVLVKPVSFISYITAKWAAAGMLTLFSLLAGFISTWYYTDVLIGPMAFGRVVAACIAYFMWLFFVITLTLLLSTWLKASAGIAFLTILFVTGLSILTGIYSKYLQWSPSRIASHAANILAEGRTGSGFAAATSVTLLLIALLLSAAVYLLRNRELKE